MQNSDHDYETRIKELGWQLTMAECDEVGLPGQSSRVARNMRWVAYGRELGVTSPVAFTSPMEKCDALTRTGTTRSEAAFLLLLAILDRILARN